MNGRLLGKRIFEQAEIFSVRRTPETFAQKQNRFA
jgi:hypothetical protein